MFGYKESPSDKMGAGSPLHLFGASPVPSDASIRQHVGEVLEQKSTSLCVSHAVAQLVRTALVIQGVPDPPLPSRLFINYGACSLNGETYYNGGTYIHSAFETLEALGVPTERAWSFSEDEAKIAAQPDWEARREAADQRWLGGHYRILTSGLDRIYQVKAALAAGHGLVWGTKVDEAILQLGPGQVWPGVTRAVVGGHATMIVGYTPDYFEICNSWGRAWADRGFGRISYAALASPNASDFWVGEVAAEFSEAA